MEIVDSPSGERENVLRRRAGNKEVEILGLGIFSGRLCFPMNYGHENRKFIRFFHVFEETRINTIFMTVIGIDITIFLSRMREKD